MRSANVLEAWDPWGYVTRVVQRSIMSEAIGDRMLISPARARKGGPMVEAPTRTGDRHWLYDQPTSPGPAAEHDDDTASDDVLLLRNAIADIVELLIGLGWPDLITDVAVGMSSPAPATREASAMPERYSAKKLTCRPGWAFPMTHGRDCSASSSVEKPARTPHLQG